MLHETDLRLKFTNIRDKINIILGWVVQSLISDIIRSPILFS